MQVAVVAQVAVEDSEPLPQCEDSLEEDSPPHHYQEAGESHYQTPKMSRCQPG